MKRCVHRGESAQGGGRKGMATSGGCNQDKALAARAGSQAGQGHTLSPGQGRYPPLHQGQLGEPPWAWQVPRSIPTRCHKGCRESHDIRRAATRRRLREHGQTAEKEKEMDFIVHLFIMLRGSDSNGRPPGYEPGELPTAPPRDVISCLRVQRYSFLAYCTSVSATFYACPLHFPCFWHRQGILVHF